MPYGGGELIFMAIELNTRKASQAGLSFEG